MNVKPRLCGFSWAKIKLRKKKSRQFVLVFMDLVILSFGMRVILVLSNGFFPAIFVITSFLLRLIHAIAIYLLQPTKMYIFLILSAHSIFTPNFLFIGNHQPRCKLIVFSLYIFFLHLCCRMRSNDIFVWRTLLCRVSGSFVHVGRRITHSSVTNVGRIISVIAIGSSETATESMRRLSLFVSGMSWTERLRLHTMHKRCTIPQHPIQSIVLRDRTVGRNHNWQQCRTKHEQFYQSQFRRSKKNHFLFDLFSFYYLNYNCVDVFHRSIHNHTILHGAQGQRSNKLRLWSYCIRWNQWPGARCNRTGNVGRL